MKITAFAKLLTAESKPYSVDGNTGTSHKLRFNVEGEIFVCKSTAEQVTEYLPLAQKEGEVTIELVSRKENLSLKVLSFEVS